MLNDSTINSRLRELINRAYNAEKLHLTRKTTSIIEGLEHKKLQELSHNVSAEVWSNINAELRKALIKMIHDKKVTNILDELNKLKQHFFLLSETKNKQLEKNKQVLLEMGERCEFYNTLNLSLDLVKLKSIIQASKAVIGEINYVIGSNNKDQIDLNNNTDSATYSNNIRVVSFNRKAM
ncbi:MAG: hypothetical protein LBE20_07400 [Deltaproteobacteria bacterium]|jgi:hypothetical protein|nr:hypothetical protein [Deltaproteobacteria bacterium]